MGSIYNGKVVVGYDGKYPLDEFGHYLDPDSVRRIFLQKANKECRIRRRTPRQIAEYNICDKRKLDNVKRFQWATELTSPYGLVEYCIGSDDFFCFDHNILEDGRVIIHCTINSETGHFIMGGGYEVVPKAEAAQVAMEFIGEAITWCCENEITHSKRGWNQDPYFFYRRVFYDCVIAEDKPHFSDRMFRHGGIKINRFCGLDWMNKK